jgi:hypothetical protein
MLLDRQLTRLLGEQLRLYLLTIFLVVNMSCVSMAKEASDATSAIMNADLKTGDIVFFADRLLIGQAFEPTEAIGDYPLFTHTGIIEKTRDQKVILWHIYPQGLLKQDLFEYVQKNNPKALRVSRIKNIDEKARQQILKNIKAVQGNHPTYDFNFCSDGRIKESQLFCATFVTSVTNLKAEEYKMAMRNDMKDIVNLYFQVKDIGSYLVDSCLFKYRMLAPGGLAASQQLETLIEFGKVETFSSSRQDPGLVLNNLKEVFGPSYKSAKMREIEGYVQHGEIAKARAQLDSIRRYLSDADVREIEVKIDHYSSNHRK